MFASRSASPVSTVITRSTGRPPRCTRARSCRRSGCPWPRGARLGEAPCGAELLARRAGLEKRVRLGARADALHRLVGNGEEGPPGRLRVDDRAAHEVRGSARDGEERGRDQATRRGLGHGQGFLARHETRGPRIRRGRRAFPALSWEPPWGPNQPIARRARKEYQIGGRFVRSTFCA